MSPVRNGSIVQKEFVDWVMFEVSDSFAIGELSIKQCPWLAVTTALAVTTVMYVAAITDTMMLI